MGSKCSCSGSYNDSHSPPSMERETASGCASCENKAAATEILFRDNSADDDALDIGQSAFCGRLEEGRPRCVPEKERKDVIVPPSSASVDASSKEVFGFDSASCKKSTTSFLRQISDPLFFLAPISDDEAEETGEVIPAKNRSSVNFNDTNFEVQYYGSEGNSSDRGSTRSDEKHLRDAEQAPSMRSLLVSNGSVRSRNSIRDSITTGFSNMRSSLQLSFGLTMSDPDDGEAKHIRSGYVWKLKRSTPITEGQVMAKVMSWRQREIALQKHGKSGRTVLTYISEKENGASALLAVLKSRSGAKPARVTTLPVVTLEAIGAELQQEVATKMYRYDKAINNAQARHSKVTHYEAEVPKKLYPLLISWKDQQNITVERVVASEDESDCRTWLISLNTAIGVRV